MTCRLLFTAPCLYKPSSETQSDRIRVSDAALDDLIKYLTDGGQVGIFDGANVEEDRRRDIHHRLIQLKFTVPLT